MANLISDGLSTLTTLNNLILVTPQKNIGIQPQNKPGLESFSQQKSLLFTYEGEQAVTLSSDVTDHYIEDNTAINDQVSLKPETITTQGYVGELTDRPPNEAFQKLSDINKKLYVVSGLTPGLSIAAQIAYNTAKQIYEVGVQTRRAALSAIDSISGKTSQQNQTEQQKMFNNFYSYWKDRTLFTVQTPWAIFENCIIMNLRAIQSSETNVISDFEVTFKVMRFAETKYQKQKQSKVFKPKDAEGRTATAGSEPATIGPNPVTPDKPLIIRLGLP